MTKEELEKATRQELIEERNYCGVDSYYSDYLDSVNAEMLKRFNRLAELEKENAELKAEKGCETCTKFDEVKLQKAKEIIRALLFHLSKDTFAVIYETKEESIKRAEQFLNSEVENDRN